MIPNAFAYDRAHTVDDALTQLCAGDAKLLAGGHSLLPLMKLRLANPQRLVDISGLKELHGIQVADGRLVIGSLTTHATIARHPLVNRHLPALAQAAGKIGDLQVRNRGTIGGNLAHADPSSDLPAVALAYDATLDIATPDGRISLPADSFFLGPLTTALPDPGILLSVSFALPPVGAKAVYVKYAHPASGYAVVGVAAVVSTSAAGAVDHVRVAVTGAADTPYRATATERALAGGELTAQRLHQAALLAAEDGSIGSDLFASEAYRRHLCAVYTERALSQLLTDQQ